jgi:putative colanic acid biosynthesis acetyltransferase WcaF
MIAMKTNPSAFRNPHTRANRIARLLWRVVWLVAFRPTPWFMGAWRTWLLKLFGAKIGFARFSSSCKVWAPWLLEVGREVYVDMDVDLYNVFGIAIGDRVVISQSAFLCGASHDYKDPAYSLIGGKIIVGDDVWIAADTFIGPGVNVGNGTVVAARAVVVKDTPQWVVVGGHPAKVLKDRTLSEVK